MRCVLNIKIVKNNSIIDREALIELFLFVCSWKIIWSFLRDEGENIWKVVKDLYYLKEIFCFNLYFVFEKEVDVNNVLVIDYLL